MHGFSAHLLQLDQDVHEPADVTDNLRDDDEAEDFVVVFKYVGVVPQLICDKNNVETKYQGWTGSLH